MANHFLFCLLAAATSFAAPQDAPKTAAPDVKEELKYPTFELFLASRFLKGLGEHLEKFDLAAVLDGLDKKEARLNPAKDAGGRADGLEEKSDAPSAELLPKLPRDQRSCYCLIPMVMVKLAPLWDAKSWSESQVTLAGQAAQILARVKGAPAIAFKKDDDANNRRELEKLVRWFYATAAKPEYLAAMIFTVDDGPYVGLPYEADKVLEFATTKALDEHTQLRLAKVDREGEAWVMQCVRDGKPMWSRVMSAAPDGTIKRVRFADSTPMQLGPYGSKVFFDVNWTYGPEQGWMCLDPKGNLLFYFLSW